MTDHKHHPFCNDRITQFMKDNILYPTNFECPCLCKYLNDYDQWLSEQPKSNPTSIKWPDKKTWEGHLWSNGWNDCLDACRKAYEEAHKIEPSKEVTEVSVEEIKELILNIDNNIYRYQISEKACERIAKAIHDLITKGNK